MKASSLQYATAAGVLGLTIAACIPPGRIVGTASPNSIAWQGDPAGVYEAEVKSVADSGLAISQQDPATGVIRTQWHETYHGGYSRMAPPSRRMMFTLSLERGQVIVTPRLEQCSESGRCRASDKATAAELALSETLAGALQSELQARNEPTPGTQVVLQSGISQPDVGSVIPLPPDPRRPHEPGPNLIRTRVAGLQEVAAGRNVEIEMASGSRLSGTITAVSPDGLVLDIGAGPQGVVIWAKDIGQVISR